MKLIWDENKRKSNLIKHKLDFADAEAVLDAKYRFDINVVRHDEMRTMSFAYVFDCLAVLTLVHTKRDQAVRVISFRPASKNETEAYYEWLESKPEQE